MIRGRCPTCSKSYEIPSIDALASFPFCSDRCKLVDLGRWIDGKPTRSPVRPSPSVNRTSKMNRPRKTTIDGGVGGVGNREAHPATMHFFPLLRGGRGGEDARLRAVVLATRRHRTSCVGWPKWRRRLLRSANEAFPIRGAGLSDPRTKLFQSAEQAYPIRSANQAFPNPRSRFIQSANEAFRSSRSKLIHPRTRRCWTPGPPP